jgi:hypothetical protein
MSITVHFGNLERHLELNSLGSVWTIQFCYQDWSAQQLFICSAFSKSTNQDFPLPTENTALEFIAGAQKKRQQLNGTQLP